MPQITHTQGARQLLESHRTGEPQSEADEKALSVLRERAPQEMQDLDDLFNQLAAGKPAAEERVAEYQRFEQATNEHNEKVRTLSGTISRANSANAKIDHVLAAMKDAGHLEAAGVHSA